MNHHHIASVLLASFLFCAPQVMAVDSIKSLEDAVTLARQQHPSVLLAVENLKKTKNVIIQTLGPARSPALRATVSYTRLSGLGAAFGGGGGAGGSVSVNNPFPIGLNLQPPGSAPLQLGIPSSPTRSRQAPGDDPVDSGGSGGVFGSNINLNQQSVQLSLTQLIDVAGSIRQATYIGDAEVLLGLQEIARIQEDVSFSVRNAWFACLRSESLVRVADSNLNRSKAQLKTAEAQLRNGTVAAYDVLRAKTQVTNDHQQLVTARNQAAIQRSSLALEIGTSADTTILLTVPTTPDEITLPIVATLNVTTLCNDALLNRPESKSADINVVKAKHNADFQKGGMNGSFALSLNGNYNPNPALVSNQQGTGSLTFVYQKPILDGGLARASNDSARVDERRAEIQREQFRRGITTEVIQAVIAVKDAQERISSSTLGLIDSREGFRLAGVRYREGVDTQLSVYDAQSVLTQAETNAVNSRYDLLMAVARLRRATGTAYVP